MKKENKMYSLEIIDKATSAVAMGFSCNHDGFKESLKDLPEEVQAAVIASVLTGQMTMHMQTKNMISKLSEIEKKTKEGNNLTEEDVNKLLEEIFDKTADKLAHLKELSYTSQLNKKVIWRVQKLIKSA